MRQANVFLSYSSQDKAFAQKLALELKSNWSVWYDSWEIRPGDSIVEKVFSGLKDSDVLVILLSQASVSSNWVQEELNVATMRRISKKNIRIIPALIDECKMPDTLSHIRYADFRFDYSIGLEELLDGVDPEYQLWYALEQHYEFFSFLSERIEKCAKGSNFRQLVGLLINLSSLITSTAFLRRKIATKHLRVKESGHTIYDAIDDLDRRGISVRNIWWSRLVMLESAHSHGAIRSSRDLLHYLLFDNKETNNTQRQQTIKSLLDDVKDLMGKMCFADPYR